MGFNGGSSGASEAGSLLPGVACIADPRLATQGAGWNGSIYATRHVMPRAGILHDLALLIVTSAGNVRLGIYDTGNALAGSRTLLWDSGAVATGPSSAAQVVGDPSLPVTVGQQLDFALQTDSGVLSIAFFNNPAADARLPPNYLPAKGGANPILAWNVTQAFGAFPASILESSLLAAASSAPAIIGRIA